MIAIDAEHKAKLMHDLNLVIEDAQVLLRMTADQVSEEAHAVRERVTQRLDKAKEELKSLQDSALESAKAAAQSTDRFVHDNPWKSVAIARGPACFSVCSSAAAEACNSAAIDGAR